MAGPINVAYSERMKTITLPAGSAMTGGQYKFVAISASGNVNLVSASGGLQVDGVLYNKPNSGDAATVVVAGVCKVIAGGVVAAGAFVASDSGGLAVTAASGGTQAVAGVALIGATAANAVIPVLLGNRKPYISG
jgi:hypothetical protein